MHPKPETPDRIVMKPAPVSDFQLESVEKIDKYKRFRTWILVFSISGIGFSVLIPEKYQHFWVN